MLALRVPRSLCAHLLPCRCLEAEKHGNSDEMLNCEARNIYMATRDYPSVLIPRATALRLWPIYESTVRPSTCTCPPAADCPVWFAYLDLLPWWSRRLPRVRRLVLAAFRLRQTSHTSVTPRADSPPSISDTSSSKRLRRTVRDAFEILGRQSGTIRLREPVLRDPARILLSLYSISLGRIGSAFGRAAPEYAMHHARKRRVSP